MTRASAGTTTIHSEVFRSERSIEGSVKTNSKLSRPTQLSPRRSLKDSKSVFTTGSRLNTDRTTTAGPTNTYGRAVPPQPRGRRPPHLPLPQNNTTTPRHPQPTAPPPHDTQ